MTKPNRSETIAIAALGLTLMSITLVAWAPPPVYGESTGSTVGFNFWQDTIAQWLMAVFGVVATVISGFAVLLVHDTLKETRKATSFAEQSAAAANDAASQARETNRIAERASILENRPWIEISELEISQLNIFEKPHPYITTRYGLSYSGSYRIRNLGKTPAIDVYSAQVYSIREQIPTLKEAIDFVLQRLEGHEPRFFQGILGPGAEDVVEFSGLVEVAEPPTMGAGYVKHDLEIALAPVVAYGSNLQEGVFHTAQAYMLKLDAAPGVHRFDPDFEYIRDNGVPANLIAQRMATSRMT